MSRHRPLPTEPVEAHIHDLTHEGQGVARVNGKAVFIPGALPGETVRFVYAERKRNFDTGKVQAILTASADRVTPACPHFDICGGCNLQHLAPAKQLEFKQKILLDNLQRLGHVTPAHITAPLTGLPWGYRRKARLGTKYVGKKQRFMIGFREKASHLLADLSQCETLNPQIGRRLPEIAAMLRALSCYQHIPQVEVAIADNATALVIRHMVPFTSADIEQLIAFAKQTGWHLYQQPHGLDSITPIWPGDSVLTYQVDKQQIELQFLPSDFIQVNREVNLAMIDAALAALQLDADMTVLELFSGLGNFTLPIARRAQHVVAVEGERGLVKRAQDNAQRNSITNVQQQVADLARDCTGLPWLHANFDRVLLDPPRSGAIEVLPVVAATKAQRIVYISCNPATLARDADVLVNQFDYRLAQVGVLDMFPHTAHVEALAVFVRN
jgi:23S rRNA (uracil1939-C5)-methyltransferase